MSDLAGIFDLVDRIGECLDRSDWDRLAAIEAPSVVLPEDAAQSHIRGALAAIEDMQARLQEEIDAVSGDLETIPTVRRAVRAYLRS